MKLPSQSLWGPQSMLEFAPHFGGTRATMAKGFQKRTITLIITSNLFIQFDQVLCNSKQKITSKQLRNHVFFIFGVIVGQHRNHGVVHIRCKIATNFPLCNFHRFRYSFHTQPPSNTKHNNINHPSSSSIPFGNDHWLGWIARDIKKKQLSYAKLLTK